MDVQSCEPNNIPNYISWCAAILNIIFATTSLYFLRKNMRARNVTEILARSLNKKDE